jgi:hypothetical protein
MASFVAIKQIHFNLKIVAAAEKKKNKKKRVKPEKQAPQRNAVILTTGKRNK